MSLHDDPRLTAYALDDPSLSADDRSAVEQLFQDDPTLRAEVESIRQLAGQLSTALAAEPAPPTDPLLVDKVKQAAAAPSQSRPRRWWLRLTIVASALALMAAVAIPTFQSAKEKVRLAQTTAALRQAPASGVQAFETAWSQGSIGVTADDYVEVIRTQPGLPAIQNPTPRLLIEDVGGVPINDVEAQAVKRTDHFSLLSPAAPRPVAVAVDSKPRSLAAVVEEKEVAELEKLKELQDNFAQPQTQFPKRKMWDFGTQGHFNTEAYAPVIENPFVQPIGERALSTFSIDVDTASYANVRRFLRQQTLPPPGAVRLEEMINYFPYNDAPPTDNEPFATRVEVAPCPWQPTHKLARITLKGRPIDNDRRPPSNLVFLIDVSGSMDQPNKLPLVKNALKQLVDVLTENDRVALAIYAGQSGLALDSTPASNKAAILYALDNLQPSGSTNGAAGIQIAYDTAVRNFKKGGTNRVILCTDGDWNVGITDHSQLFKMIEDKRKTGVFLSVLGFGMGNLKDQMMVSLADKGNGNYAYIDSVKEAKKVLVEQMGGTLVAIAKDVKLQIEFNPQQVGAYRLVGYEKRVLRNEDFHDDKKDAGEIGAGHVVTAFYEIAPPGANVAVPPVDPLKYQPAPKSDTPANPTGTGAPVNASTDLFTLKLRYKPIESDTSVLRSLTVPSTVGKLGDASTDFRFSAAVASFGMLLRGSEFKGTATYASVLQQAEGAFGSDIGAYRAEFVELVKIAQRLAGHD